jgi:hypothetical protein
LVAALVIGVFLYEWRDGPDDPRRPLYQVALAFALLSAVLALSQLLFPLDGLQGSFEGTVGLDESRKALRLRSIFHALAGFALLLAGVRSWRAYPTLTIGVLLAGAMLMMIASTADPTNIVQIYYDFSTDAGVSRNGAFAAVTMAGSVGLIYFGYKEWDQVTSEAVAETDDASL